MNNLQVVNTQLPDKAEDLAKFVLVGREKLTAVRAEIRAIDKVGMAKEVHEQKLEEAQKIAEVVLDAERKIGELTAALPKAERLRTDLLPDTAVVQTKTNAIRELGFSPKQAERFEVLAKHPDLVEEVKAEARENGDIPTRAAVLQKVKEAQREIKERAREEQRIENAEKVAVLDDPLEAQGLFQTIVIDPPWDWGDEGDVNQLGRAKPDYSTMPIEEIERLPVGDIADENCHLYLWVTNRSLPKAFRLMEVWGFRYITCITWVKPHFGMGNYFRGSTEQVLFGVKGSQMLKRKDVGTYFTAPRGNGHSAKPEEFYQLIESCSYGPYIDIFGRKQRDGWSVWGEDGGT